MNYRFKNKVILNLFIIGLCFYLVFYFTMIAIDSVLKDHVLFLDYALFIISFCVFIISLQNKNKVLVSGCSILLATSGIEIIFDIIKLINLNFVVPEVIQIIIQIIMAIALLVFAIGIYFEMKQIRKQTQINLASFVLNDAIYFEYDIRKENIIIEFSKKFLMKYHLKDEKIVVDFEQFQSFFHRDDRKSIKFFNEYMDFKSDVEIKVRMKFPNMRTYVHLIIRGSFYSDHCYSCLGFDISDIEKVSQTLLTKMNEFDSYENESKKIIQNTNALVIKVNMAGNIVFATDNFANLYPDENIIGSSIFKLYEQHGNFDHSWFEQTVENHSYIGQGKVKTKDKTLWISWTNDVIFDKDGEVEFVICIGHDITDLVNLNLDLDYRRSHHTLTGLLNNHGYNQTIQKLNDVKRAICFFIDISDFTSLNNYYGNDISDLIVKTIASDLNEYAKGGHLVSCYYGEKFSVLLINPNETEIANSLKRMKDSILTICDVNEVSVQVKKNIGYAIYPDDTNDLSQLVSLASLAMKSAVMNEHNILSKYQPYMSKQLEENIKMATHLFNAIENEEIDIYFQKIVNSENNEIPFVEALARWNDEELGYVRPDYFIKVAKQSGLIDSLDEYLVKAAISRFAVIKEQEIFEKTKLSINLTPSTFLRNGFVKILERIVLEHGLKIDDICIEISENTFVNNLDICNKYINEYKERGFIIAIDDFGSEYSSLSILENINYDIIKIDGSFVNKIDSPNSRTIIEMIIKIASFTKKHIIAESVETAIASEQLKSLTCILQQGYYYHKPEKLA